MITLLTTPEGLRGEDFQVGGEAYRHLFRARRVAAGERLRVVDGEGHARWGQVAQVDRAAAIVRLGAPARSNEPSFHLSLFVPTCRPERAAFVVEKGTELGVVSFRFLHTARAPRDLGAASLRRLERVAAAALEQCHRARLPAITGPHAWSELPELAEGASCRWVLDVAPEGSAVGAGESGGWGEIAGPAGALLVGPEGGWTEEERRELGAAGWRSVQLGERTLRLETAALAGAAIVLLELEKGSARRDGPAAPPST
jgi:16S rRNA (uracil1498-N3)-methyltransferase